MTAPENGKGWLAIVGTPIGNLEDITLRALRILKEADTILAEDTRHTLILLNHFQIAKHLESHHIYNEHGKTAGIVRRVLKGEKIALVSDAGMPCVADPGFLLVREAVAAGIEPEIVPGPSAVIFSAAASALPSDRFAFHGFLPVKSGRRDKRLKEIASSNMTAIVFESPYRIGKLLKELPSYYPPATPVALIREATKVHQEILRGTAGELAEQFGNRVWKGEFAIVIAPAVPEEPEEPEK